MNYQVAIRTSTPQTTCSLLPTRERGSKATLLFRRCFLEELDEAYPIGQLHFFGEFVHLNDAAAFANWLKPLRTCEWGRYLLLSARIASRLE